MSRQDVHRIRFEVRQRIEAVGALPELYNVAQAGGDVMTDTDMAVAQYGYEPQEVNTTRNCGCGGHAIGRTRYWWLDSEREVWHCADHLPSEARTYGYELGGESS